MEQPTKTVPRPSPKRAISKRTSPRPMAAEPQPSSETGKRVAAATSKTSPFRLAVPCAAKERPSCGGNPSTPGVPAGGAEEEGASWGNTPRPSAGRPRKVSRRSAEKPSRRFVWRPRKVSQGTTDPIPKNLTPRYQWRKRRGKNKQDEKTHARHRGRRRSVKNVGTALQNHLMESWLLLGGDARRSEGLHPKGREDGRSRSC